MSVSYWIQQHRTEIIKYKYVFVAWRSGIGKLSMELNSVTLDSYSNADKGLEAWRLFVELANSRLQREETEMLLSMY